jgi:hypothetical protein
MNKTSVGRKLYYKGQMWKVDLAAAKHLLSPFSSPFFGVKFLMTMGFEIRTTRRVFLF